MIDTIEAVWVDDIPVSLDEGKLYISLKYGTTIHICACGCGSEVPLKIGPSHWSVIWNGRNVSLFPSVGNWQLACRSHYCIIEDKIIKADDWSSERIKRNRRKTRRRRTPAVAKRLFRTWGLREQEYTDDT